MKIYNIEGLACAACASSAQKVLGRTKGVSMAKVNYATKTAAVQLDQPLELSDLNTRLERIGFKLYPKNKSTDQQRQEQTRNALQLLRQKLAIGIVFAVPLFMIAMFFPTIPYANYAMLALTLPIIGWSGRHFYSSAWRQARVGKVNMDTLVALGTGTAFLFSCFNTFLPEVLLANGLEPHVYFEAVGVLLVFVLLGKYWEAKANLQTTSAVEALLAMQVDTVQLIEDEKEITVPIEMVAVGELIKVRSGDKIPLDATLLEGQLLVDESMLTGEPVPVDKGENATLFGGTIVQQGSAIIEVTHTGEDTVLAQIIKLVEEAQNSQVPIQKLVDKISAIFVPTVLVIALLTLLFWGLNGAIVEGIVAAVTVLVVACPCALGLATPTAIMVGIGEATKRGVLIRKASAIQKITAIDTIILDKTGTITEGMPQLTDLYWKSNLDAISNLEMLLLSLENESQHPIAQGLVATYKKKGLTPQIVVENFQNYGGMGISGVMENSNYYIGNLRLMEMKEVVVNKEMSAQVQVYEQENKTVAYFANEQEVLAVLAFSDIIKSTSKQGIEQLKAAGKAIYMLTGDNQATAGYTAAIIGIESFQANVLPEDKIAFVQTLQQQGKKVMMVGDGINDAPALAQADVGVAMNKGTAVAINSAEIVLRNNDLQQLDQVFSIATRMLSTIRQNLFWAFIYNILLIPVAAGVLMPWGIVLNPMLAGAAMALSSVFVVTNSLRLKQNV